MARVSSQKSSFQHLYDAPLQRRTSPIVDNITSHVCGFCATSLGVWSSSRLAHQTTHQSFPAGTSGATQNHAQVGPSSCFVIIAETTIRIRRWCWRGILGWCHSPKMADHEMCVPVSIGFGKTALIPARFECRARQMCVPQRKHTATTCGISVAGTWFPSEESATEPGPWMDHRARDCPLESDGSGEIAVSCQTVETLHTGFWKNPGRPSADVYTLESQHQKYYEEPHEPMDRGDCQGSLHSSWSRIWPSEGTSGQSPFSIMGIQLSGSPSWHPVSGVLEVIWGVPEFVSTRHGLYRWWHVDTGSSGGRTTSSGSRTSSPSSIACTICMQPLLWRS